MTADRTLTHQIVVREVLLLAYEELSCAKTGQAWRSDEQCGCPATTRPRILI